MRSFGRKLTRLHFYVSLVQGDPGSPGNAAEEYCFGNICVFEAQVEWFSRETDKLAAPYDAAAPEDVEFHASTIFSRREYPWKGLSIDEPKNGSSSPSTAAGPNVYTAAGCIAQSPVGRSAEQLRGTIKLGLPRCSGVSNCRV